MTICSVTIETRDQPGVAPLGFSGTERVCGNFIENITRRAYDDNLRINMNIGPAENRMEVARLMAFAKFVGWMEKIEPNLVGDFDYRLLMEWEKPQ